MLVFVSDLHYRDHRALTVTPKMTRGFITKSLVPQASDAGVKKLVLVFLGDIPDINRSSHWASGRSAPFLPWSDWQYRLHEVGKGDRPTERFDAAGFEKQSITVLKAIGEANQESYAYWREFKNTQSELWHGAEHRPESIEYVYIPGNHDRLVQFSQATRQTLIDQLALDHDAVKPFPWVYVDPDCPVLALHGHVLDKNNFGGGEKNPPKNFIDDPWYSVPAFGDTVTVRLGQRIVELFGQEYGLTLDSSPLLRSLARIDLVRPQNKMVDWLKSWTTSREGNQSWKQVDKSLDRILDRIIREMVEDEYVKYCLKNHVGWFAALFSTVADDLAKFFDLNLTLKILNQLQGEEHDPREYEKEMVTAVSKGAFADWARAHHPDARYIVSGHTHRADVIPLAGSAGDTAQDERIYFNTGCWVDVIESGRVVTDRFVLTGQVGHVAFYADGEDVKTELKRKGQWEFWTGAIRETAVSAIDSGEAPVSLAPSDSAALVAGGASAPAPISKKIDYTAPIPEDVIDMHMHVGLRGDSQTLKNLGGMRGEYTKSFVFWAFKQFVGMGNEQPTDELLHEKTLEVLQQTKVRRVVLLALDPYVERKNERESVERRDISQVWVANEYITDHLQPGWDKILFGCSVNPNRHNFAELTARYAAKNPALMKWLPSAQGIDLAADHVGKALEFLATARPGGKPLPLLLHCGPEHAIPPPEGHEYMKAFDFLEFADHDLLALPRSKRWIGDPERVQRIHRNLTNALDKGAVIIFAHCGTPYYSMTLHNTLLEHSDFHEVRKYLLRTRTDRPEWKGRCFADISAFTSWMRQPFFDDIKALPPETLVYGSDFPVPVFELSGDIKEGIEDIIDVLKTGQWTRLVVPENNLLDVNYHEMARVFGPEHPVFANFTRLLEQQGVIPAGQPIG